MWRIVRSLLMFLAMFFVAQSSVAQSDLGVDWKGITPASAGSRDIYLYNIGTGCFATAGGLWGTQFIVYDIAMPIRLEAVSNSTYYMKTSYSRSSSSDMTYITYSNGSNLADADSIFVDGSYKSSYSAYHQYTFTSVSGMTNVYTITVNNKYLYADSRGYGIKGGSSATSSSYYWMIITEDEIVKAFENVGTGTDRQTSIDATYLVKAAKFDVGGALSSWKWKKNDNDTPTSISTNLTKRQPSDSYSDGYYVGYGYDDGTSSENDPFYDDDFEQIAKPMGLTSKTNGAKFQRYMGGYMSVNIHGQGMIYQEITVKEGGWYSVSIAGFTTSTTGEVNVFATSSYSRYKSDKAALTSLSASAAPTTYATAALFVDNNPSYRQEALVYVPADGTLTIGVDATNADDDAWTCFDDVEIAYWSGSVEPHIVLSEQREDIDYINTQVDPGVQNADGTWKNSAYYTLFLDRTLYANQWNALVLPVALTAAQVKLAFGGDTKLSKLSSITRNGSRINFKSVDLTTDATTVIEPDVLYIIKPTIATPSQLLDGESTVELTVQKYQHATQPLDDGETGFYEDDNSVYAANYYVIPRVKLANGLGKSYSYASAIDDSNNVTTKKCSDGYGESSSDGASTGFATRQTLDTDGNTMTLADGSSLSFHGTYVYKKTTTASNGTKSYPVPVGSIVLSKSGDWYHTQTKGNSIKAFRTWLQTSKTGATSASKLSQLLSFAIDDVLQGETTLIEGLEVDDFSATSEHTEHGDVYTLSGQLVRRNIASTDDLPRGIYIIGGKKYVVR